MTKDTTALPSTATTHSVLAKHASEDVAAGSIPIHYQVTNLDFDVTENCNLGCSYCFKGEMYSKSMSLKTMKQTFEWLLDASGAAPSVNCNFMGGEPTMRFKQIKRFVPWARRRARGVGKQATFSMTTNLTLFTEEMRQFVDEYGFGVLMSIDGSPEVQDAQRPAKNGKPMSEVVAYWARSMLKTRPNCQARATVHPTYVGKFLESAQYIHELGFVELAVSASNYEEWTTEHFMVLQEQLNGIVEYIAKVYQEGGDFNISAFKYYGSKLVHLREEGREDDIVVQRAPCGAGKGYMMVDYTGDIWPCHRFDGADDAAGLNGQMRLGNIYAEGFNHDLQLAFMDFDHFEEHKPACTTCPVNKVCGGYCPAANLSDTGSIYTPHDGYCKWTQMMYSFSHVLYRKMKGIGGEPLERFMASAANTEGTGEK